MGQKINPVSFRTGVFLPWKSRWFVDKKIYREHLLEDIKVRGALMSRLKLAGITQVEIERLPKSMAMILTVSRPGVVIGRGGTGLEDLKKFILKTIGEVRGQTFGQLEKDIKIEIRVEEVKNPETSAYLVAGRIVSELERRLPHRRVIAKTMERVIQAGALGVKIILSGRIGGADISRREKYHTGSVPSQTLRENIDYAQQPALLKKGYVGVKVYIHKKSSEE